MPMSANLHKFTGIEGRSGQDELGFPLRSRSVVNPWVRVEDGGVVVLVGRGEKAVSGPAASVVSQLAMSKQSPQSAPTHARRMPGR
jgi:hypothetical protein